MKTAIQEAFAKFGGAARVRSALENTDFAKSQKELTKVAAEIAQSTGITMAEATKALGEFAVIARPTLPQLDDFLEETTDRQALADFRSAWSLYRTGAATLEEITPLMDAALEDSLEPQYPLPGEYAAALIEPPPMLSARSPGYEHRIPRHWAQVGQKFIHDGKLYEIIQAGSDADEVVVRGENGRPFSVLIADGLE